MKVSAEHILDERNLRHTGCRKDMLALFLSKPDQALAENDIRSELRGDFDRVTVYRTLNTFIDEHVLEKHSDQEGHVFYILDCSLKDAHINDPDHSHIFFYCDNCDKVELLHYGEAANLKLPAGYEARSVNFIARGTCPAC